MEELPRGFWQSVGGITGRPPPFPPLFFGISQSKNWDAQGTLYWWFLGMTTLHSIQTVPKRTRRGSDPYRIRFLPGWKVTSAS